MKQSYFKVLATLFLMLCIPKVYAQNISNVTPSVGMEGTTINVTISGQNSNFLQGTTTVWFNQGSSTLLFATSVNVANPTSLVAQLSIPYGTPLGLYQTNVNDPVDNTISLANSFTVAANPNQPAIVNVSPSSTMEGTTLTVSITGQNSNFQQGTTTVWFNQGSSTIYSSNVTVNSATSLDALFNIPFGTPLGWYNTNVNDPLDNTITSQNSFLINSNPNAPQLLSVTPNNGDLNTTIPVTISGQNTNFLQGTATLVFVQGSSTLITSNFIYFSNTGMGASLTIPANANPGYYDVYLTNPLDGTMLLVDGFYVNPPPCGPISVYLAQQPCPGDFANIMFSGGYYPYTMVLDGQTVVVNGNQYSYLPPSIGDFAITSVVDNFGCPATSMDSIIHNEEIIGSITATNACEGAVVNFTTNVTYSSPISTIYYYPGNGAFSATDSYTYNDAGIYTPSMMVFTSNGCSTYITAANPFEIYGAPDDSLVSLTNANCGQTNGSFEIAGVGNGPFTYNVSGIGGYNSNTAVNTGLAAGVYNISITDTNGCASASLLSVANITNLTNITGHIQTAALDSANNTIVNLFDVSDTSGAMGIAYSTVTDVNGNYSFSNLAEGAYLLQAVPDTALFPNALVTYSNGTSVWFNADTLQVNCTSQQQVNISLLNEVAQTGTAYIGGFVAQYNTFNLLPDVALVLYDDVAAESVARTYTDATGNYSFNGINAGHYSIFVDYPGISHNTLYTFNATASSNLWNKSYFVDLNYRIIDTVYFLVGVKEMKQASSKVYPNPFKDQTTINYTLPTDNYVTLEVYNFAGERVETLVNEFKTAGNHHATFNAVNRAKGIYFIRITAGNYSTSLKVISVE